MKSTKSVRVFPLAIVTIAVVIGLFLLVQLMIVPVFGAAADITAVDTHTTTSVDHSGSIRLNRVGTYVGSGAEIVSYDADSQRLFVVTGGENLEILDISNPITPTLVVTVPVGGGGANSVSVHDGYVATAVQNSDKTANGFASFYDVDGNFVVSVTVGALPDMITFTPDGQKVIVANEGEPNDDYTIDPEGSVSVIDVSGGIVNLTQTDVTHIDFTDFNVGGSREADLPADVRIFGPGASVAQDLEPEYVAVSKDSSTAWITLQENNAIAIIDLATNEITEIAALGFKDHSAFGNQLDPSNRDDGIVIGNWPVKGMYMPDSIAAYEVDGETYLITGNEGDSRDYAGFSEEVRVADLMLDPAVFTPTAFFTDDTHLGRLKTTITMGDADHDDLYEEIYAYGARSFSVWSDAGSLVFDSGDQFEHLTAAFSPTIFNSEGATDTFDDRSDDKGPEPEGVTKGVVNGRTYAFIGLERISGIMVYDVTDPTMPTFVQYVPPTNGEVAPEGLLFISAEDSPTCNPLLVVAYEVSKHTTVYKLGATACETYLPILFKN